MSEPLKNIQPQVGCPYVPCGGYSAKAKRVKSVAPFTADKLKNIHTELVTCPYVNCGSFSGTKSKRVYTAENLAAIYKNIHTREDCPFVECVCPESTALLCNCGCHDWYVFIPNLPAGWSWIDGPYPSWNDGFKKLKLWGSSSCEDTPDYNCIHISELDLFAFDWGHWVYHYIDDNNRAEFFFTMWVECHYIVIPPTDPGLIWTPGIYSQGICVNYADSIWESLEDENDGIPGEDIRWKLLEATRELHIVTGYELQGEHGEFWVSPWGGPFYTNAQCCHIFETTVASYEYISPYTQQGDVRGAICIKDEDDCSKWETGLLCSAPETYAATGDMVFYPTSCTSEAGVAAIIPQVFDFLPNTGPWHVCCLAGEQLRCWKAPDYQCLWGFTYSGWDHPIYPPEDEDCPAFVCFGCYHVPTIPFAIEIAHRPARAGGVLTCKDLCQAYFASNKAFDLWPWAAFYIDHLSIHSTDPRNDPDNIEHLLGKKAATFIDDPDGRCRRRVLLESVEFEGEPLTPVPWIGFWFEEEMVGAVEATQECYFNIDGRLELYTPCEEPENSWVYYTGCPDPIWGQLKPPADINAETTHIPKIHGQLNANVTAVAVTATPTYLDPDNFPCVPTCP